MSQVLLVKSFLFNNVVFCLWQGNIGLIDSNLKDFYLFDCYIWKQKDSNFFKNILLEITIFKIYKADFAKLDSLILWLFIKIWNLIAKNALFGCVLILDFFSTLSLSATGHFVLLQRF